MPGEEATAPRRRTPSHDTEARDPDTGVTATSCELDFDRPGECRKTTGMLVQSIVHEVGHTIGIFLADELTAFAIAGWRRSSSPT